MLSLRLGTVFSLIDEGAAVCDVGTDHAHLAIELLKTGKAKKVIASDIAEKPLLSAKRNIEAANITGVELRLSNGIEALKKGEVDTVVIAGMGGEVIAGILERGLSLLKEGAITLVLQPTTSPEKLREFLCLNGFQINEELPVFENGKTYSVMKSCYKGNCVPKSPAFYYIGKLTPETEAGALYINKQLTRLSSCMTALEHIPEKQDEYLEYKAAFDAIKEVI